MNEGNSPERQTLLKKIKKRIEDNPVLVCLMLVGALVIAVGTFAEALDKIAGILSSDPSEQPPPVTLRAPPPPGQQHSTRAPSEADTKTADDGVVIGQPSPTPTSGPAESTETSKTIAIRSPRILVEEWTGNEKSKFSSYAFAEEGIVVEAARAKTFTYDPEKDYSGVIVEVILSSKAKQILADLRTFVEEGGRAALFVCMHHSQYNGEFQDVFSFSVMREWNLISVPTEEISVGRRVTVPGEDISPLFRGLTLAGGAFREDSRGYTPGIKSSLKAVGKEWLRNPVSIQGEEHSLSAWRKLGKGEILFLASFDRGGYGGPRPFIMDQNIEVEDNLEAAMRLVRWLAGETEYSK